MKIIFIVITTVLSLLLLGCSTTPANHAIELNNIEDLDSIIIQNMNKKQIPGLAIAVIRNGEVIYKNIFGYSVVEHKVKVKLETTFELASLTKQFVAAGILLLVKDRKVDLDERIEKYVDSLPGYWKDLTIRQLLSHTAGLAAQGEEYASLHPWPKYVSKQMMWEAAVADSVSSSPGQTFSYSNTGYFLAEVIIENVTNEPYQKFFQERIFNPLQLENTYFEDQVKVIPNAAQGYTLRDKELIKIWRVSQEEMAGGWGIWSSLPDMIRWSQALVSNELLNKEIQEEMFKPIQLSSGESFRYGLGWFVTERHGITYYYHNGRTGPEMLILPDEKLTVIVLGNLGLGVGLLESSAPNPYGMADVVASSLVPEFKFDPKPEPIDKEELNKLTGHYSFEYDNNVLFYTKEDQLYIKDIYGEDPMIHIGERVFTFLNTPPVYYQFIDTANVKVKEETWQNDMGKRIR